MLIRSFVVPTVIAVLLLPGCTPDDPGDEAFAQQVIPLVLGRKAKGSAEIDALSAFVAANDRALAVDELLAHEEDAYVDYWTLVIADALKVRRGDPGVELLQSGVCWGPPMATADPVTGKADALALADHIANGSPGSSFSGGAWNMTDAVRAALYADDLSVAWLAYLPAMAGAMQSPADEYEAREQFDNVFLDRAPDCIACHSSSYSTVDTPSGWDRHATSPCALEASVFRGDGNGPAVPTPSVQASYTNGQAIFTGSDPFSCGNGGCHGSAGLAEQDVYREGIAAGTPIRLASRVPVLSDDQIRAKVRSGGQYGYEWMPAFGPGVLPDSDLDDVILYLRSTFGGESDVQKYFRHSTADGVVPPGGVSGVAAWGIDSSCAPAIEPVPHLGRDAGFAGGRELTPDVVDLADKLNGGLDGLRAAIDGAPATAPDAVDLPLLAGEHAFAYLVASKVADELTFVATGSRPTVAHGFARNEDQEAVRQAVVDAIVAPPGLGATRSTLSLRSALREAGDFNFNAPADSVLPDPYPWDMYLEPWVATEPGETALTGADANSVGDLVHRHDPVTLLWATHKSLGWPAPEVFRHASDYPDESLAIGLGAYQNDAVPGFEQWDGQSWAVWEAQVGACVNPDPTTADWIDALRDAAVADPDPLTVLDTFEAVRDRLLGDPEIPALELDAIETGLPAAWEGLLGTTSFPKTNVAAQDTVEAGLRGYCGALLVSPQYVMAGMPLVTTGPTTRRLEVCLPGEVCTFTDLSLLYQ